MLMVNVHEYIPDIDISVCHRRNDRLGDRGVLPQIRLTEALGKSRLSDRSMSAALR